MQIICNLSYCYLVSGYYICHHTNTQSTMNTHTATLHVWPSDVLTREHITAPVKITNEPRFYSASGYGRKIPTRYMVRIGNRWRRVYVCCISNSGTAYVGKPGAWSHVVDDVSPR